MKLVIVAGPSTTGKTSVIRHLIRLFLRRNKLSSYLKVDVQFADEDEVLYKEFRIPTKKVYSGELCPDHAGVMVLGDAIKWAHKNNSGILFIETAGLCLRCSPYVDGGYGIVALEATSGMNLPFKIGPMLSLSDVAVITKIDRVSQAEREVFRARIMSAAPSVKVKEVNALHGSGITSLATLIESSPDISFDKNGFPANLKLRGNPPAGTCTICVGKKEIGWQSHFGVVRPLDKSTFYRGE